jgi:hypothetical protein
MPRNTKIQDTLDTFVTVIWIGIRTFVKGCTINRKTKEFEIIFVFANRSDTFYSLDINNGISDHARITAGTCQAKGMTMLDIKFPRTTLNHKPRLMIREYWTGAMEFSNVKGTCLGAQGRKGNLRIAC